MYYFCKNTLFGLVTVIVFIGFVFSAFIISTVLFIGFILWFIWNYSHFAAQKKLNHLFEI